MRCDLHCPSPGNPLGFLLWVGTLGGGGYVAAQLGAMIPTWAVMGAALLTLAAVPVVVRHGTSSNYSMPDDEFAYRFQGGPVPENYYALRPDGGIYHARSVPPYDGEPSGVPQVHGSPVRPLKGAHNGAQGHIPITPSRRREVA